MAKEYLDEIGLAHFWGKIKSKFTPLEEKSHIHRNQENLDQITYARMSRWDFSKILPISYGDYGTIYANPHSGEEMTHLAYIPTVYHGDDNLLKLTGTGLYVPGYTKEQIDGMVAGLEASVSGVFHFQGTVANYAELSRIANAKEGDVYQVMDGEAEYAYNGTEWVELGTTVDLSNYVTHSHLNTITNAYRTADEALSTRINANKSNITALENQLTNIISITNGELDAICV